MKSFKEKVLEMTGKEIILMMVDSIRNPVITLDMDTFGQVNRAGHCFGCAATNTVCKIAGIEFNEYSLETSISRAMAVNCDERFYAAFKSAIDSLRKCQLYCYNIHKPSGMAEIKYNEATELLPRMKNNWTEDDLKVYEEFAATLP